MYTYVYICASPPPSGGSAAGTRQVVSPGDRGRPGTLTDEIGAPDPN